MKFSQIAAAVALTVVASTASATAITGNALQNQLNTYTDNANTPEVEAFYDVNNAQYNPDERWAISGLTDGSLSRYIFDISFDDVTIEHEFGIYDLNNENNTLTLFNTADGSCEAAPGRRARQCSTTATYDEGFGVFYNESTDKEATFGSGDSFGYYLTHTDTNGSVTVYSESALNGGTDHMVAFKGDDKLQLDITGDGNFGTFGAGEYILAWEDGADFDFADVIIGVESVNSVPEPAPLAVLGLALAGFGLRRRQK